MKYIITKTIIKGHPTIKDKIETDCLSTTRKEIAERFSVSLSKVKFQYDETDEKE